MKQSGECREYEEKFQQEFADAAESADAEACDAAVAKACDAAISVYANVAEAFDTSTIANVFNDAVFDGATTFSNKAAINI